VKASIHINVRAEEADSVQELLAALKELGITTSCDETIGTSALVIAASDMSLQQLQECFDRGLIVIPAAHLSIDQVLTASLSFAASMTDLADLVAGDGDDGTTSRAGQKGMERIDTLLESLAEAHVLEQLAVFLSTTQHVSLPLLEAGQYESCLIVCKHAAHSLLELLQVAEFEDEAADVVQAIAEAVASATLEVEESDYDASTAVDRLLDCFSQLSLGLQTASALMLVEETFSDLHGSGREANAPLLYDVIQLTLSQCEDLFEEMAFSWCGHIYLLAAKHLNQLIGATRTNEDVILTFARDRLEPFLEIDDESLDDDPEAIVMALHRVLIDILENAEHERPWAHDS
jgi:hypothetical protein